MTLRQVLSDVEIYHLAAPTTEPHAEFWPLARAVEAAVLAKVEPECRERERKAWSEAYSFIEHNITIIGALIQFERERDRRYPSLTPREVVGPSGTRYAMVDGKVCTPTNKSAYAERWEWHPVFKMIPIEDAAVVAQLMQETNV